MRARAEALTRSWAASPGLWAASIVALFGAVRLGFAGTFELVPQEAYYLLYARHPALSYFDHPPMVAWALWLFTSCLGLHVLAIRLTAFTLTALTLVAWYSLARRLCGADTSPRALLLWGTCGVVTISSLISTPDVPLLLFWALALHQLHAALFDGRHGSWVLAGALIGLAFDSKYTAVFLPLGLGLFLVTSRPHRRWLKTPWPYAALLAGQVMALPVYVWNAQHGFASFLFQSAARAEHAQGPQLTYLARLLGTQTALLGPILLVAILVGLARAARAGPADERRWFLFLFSAPMVLFFGAVSVVSLVKPNWLLPAYLAGTLLAAQVLGRRLSLAHVATMGLLHALAGVQLIAYPFNVDTDDTWVGWSELAREVDRRVAERPGAFAVSADGYKTTAELRFYARSEVYAGDVLGLPALQFDYWPVDLERLRGRDALFLDSTPGELSPRPLGAMPPELDGRCARIEEGAPVLIHRGGRVVRRFSAFWCERFSPPSATAQTGAGRSPSWPRQSALAARP